MDVYRKEYLESLKYEEIMALVVASYEIKSFNIVEVDVLEEERDLKYKQTITKDDLLEYFDTNQEERKYVFPYLDEETTGRFFGQRVVPAKDFLWKVKAKKRTDAFGLVAVDFSIKAAVRNDDTRFTSESDKYKENKVYFYDYVKEVYEQVDLNAENEKTVEYKARREAADYAYERLGRYYYEYLDFLGKSVPGIIELNSDNQDSSTTFKLIEQCSGLLNDVRKFIPVKMFFGHVENHEYDGLLERLDWLEIEISKKRIELEDWLSKNGQDYIDFTSFLQSNEYTVFFENFGEFMREKFIRFFFFDNSKDKSFASEKGFWKCVDGRLYPTVFEVERRRHFTEEANRYTQYLSELGGIAGSMMKAKK